jgi:hypothetical protein
MWLFTLLFACAPAHDWLPPGLPEPLRVQPSAATGGFTAMMYVARDTDAEADLCLRVFGDNTWTLSERSGPGVYGHEIARGSVAGDGTVVGLPAAFFTDAKGYWRSDLGGTFTMGGAPVP